MQSFIFKVVNLRLKKTFNQQILLSFYISFDMNITQQKYWYKIWMCQLLERNSVLSLFIVTLAEMEKSWLCLDNLPQFYSVFKQTKVCWEIRCWISKSQFKSALKGNFHNTRPINTQLKRSMNFLDHVEVLPEATKSSRFLPVKDVLIQLDNQL